MIDMTTSFMPPLVIFRSSDFLTWTSGDALCLPVTLLGFCAVCCGNPLSVPLSPRKVYTIVTHFLWDTMSVFLLDIVTIHLDILLDVPLSPRKEYTVIAFLGFDASFNNLI